MDATLRLAGVLLVVLACAGHANAQVATDSYLYAQTNCSTPVITKQGNPDFPTYLYTSDCPLPNTTNKIQHFIANIAPKSVTGTIQDAGFFLNAAGKRLEDIVKPKTLVISPTPPGGSKDYTLGPYPPNANGESSLQNISSIFTTTNEVFTNETYSPVYHIVISTLIEFPVGKPIVGYTSIEWYIDAPPPPPTVAAPTPVPSPPLVASPPSGSVSPPPPSTTSASQPVHVLGAALVVLLCIVALL